jgi:toxin CptA
MRELKLKPSRRLGLGLLILGLLVCVAIAQADVPVPLQGSLMMVVGGAVYWHMQRAATLPGLALAQDGSLHARAGDGDWEIARVLPDSLVSTRMIVLRYRGKADRTRTWILLPDSASADDLRRLRVSLRWARHTRSDTSSPGAG